jgi:hypothetical protein
MATPLYPTSLRYCRHCGQPIPCLFPGGKMLDRQAYQQRVYCSVRCTRQAQSYPDGEDRYCTQCTKLIPRVAPNGRHINALLYATRCYCSLHCANTAKGPSQKLLRRKQTWQARRDAGVCPECGGPRDRPGRLCCLMCSTEQATVRRRHRERAKRYWTEAMLDGYGRRCSCCGEATILFLELDHVNNDGALHRRSDPNMRNSYQLYRWVVEHGYPDSFQLLCANCNKGKARNGGVCPHKTENPRKLAQIGDSGEPKIRRYSK